MKKGLKVLKEIGIALLLIVGVVIVAAIVFIDKIPIAIEIPEPEVYVTVDRDEFLVANDGIENAQSATVIYESTSTDLENYGSDLRYISGRTEPLTNSDSSTADIPTDIIGQTNQKK